MNITGSSTLKTFELNGHGYRVGRLDPFQQVHLARKLLPIIASGLDSNLLHKVKTMSDLVDIGMATLLRSMAVPFSYAVAQMPDADAEYVMRLCFSVCERREDGGSAPSWTALQDKSTGQLMYRDIDALETLRIVSEVVQVNLASFFDIARRSSSDSKVSEQM